MSAAPLSMNSLGGPTQSSIDPGSLAGLAGRSITAAYPPDPISETVNVPDTDRPHSFHKAANTVGCPAESQFGLGASTRGQSQEATLQQRTGNWRNQDFFAMEPCSIADDDRGQKVVVHNTFLNVQSHSQPLRRLKTFGEYSADVFSREPDPEIGQPCTLVPNPQSIAENEPLYVRSVYDFADVDLFAPPQVSHAAVEKPPALKPSWPQSGDFEADRDVHIVRPSALKGKSNGDDGVNNRPSRKISIKEPCEEWPGNERSRLEFQQNPSDSGIVAVKNTFLTVEAASETSSFRRRRTFGDKPLGLASLPFGGGAESEIGVSEVSDLPQTSELSEMLDVNEIRFFGKPYEQDQDEQTCKLQGLGEPMCFSTNEPAIPVLPPPVYQPPSSTPQPSSSAPVSVDQDGEVLVPRRKGRAATLQGTNAAPPVPAVPPPPRAAPPPAPEVTHTQSAPQYYAPTAEVELQPEVLAVKNTFLTVESLGALQQDLLTRRRTMGDMPWKAGADFGLPHVPDHFVMSDGGSSQGSDPDKYETMQGHQLIQNPTEELPPGAGAAATGTSSAQPPAHSPVWRSACRKTRLCKFNAAGLCAMGASCAFAHDEGELRAAPDLYKTKMCPTMLRTGRCDQAACTYAHNSSELRTRGISTEEGMSDGNNVENMDPADTTPSGSVNIFRKTKQCRFHAIGVCTKGRNCKFAHGTVESRPLPDLFRTKLCFTLSLGGICTNAGCRFAHSREELRVQEDSPARSRRQPHPSE